MHRAIMAKVDSRQEQMQSVSRELEILRRTPLTPKMLEIKNTVTE